MRPSPGLALLLALSVATCSDPATSTEPQKPLVAFLAINAPSTLVVHQHKLISVSGEAKDGEVIYPLPEPPVLASEDPTVVSISQDGVVSALRRGSTRLSIKADGVDTTVAIHVVARVSVALEGLPPWPGRFRAAIGDTLQLVPSFVDEDGLPIDDPPQVTWSSNAPDLASVDSSGLVATHDSGSTEILASTPDGAVAVELQVTDAHAGQPVTVRFANAIRGIGPVTFRPSKGHPVTLGFGESAELAVTSGTLIVNVDGFPKGQAQYDPFRYFVGIIRPGDRLSVFAIGGTTQGFLVGVWPAQRPPVGSDSGLVRMVQGWTGFGVMYLAAFGGGPAGLPAECYFDPMNTSPYYPVPAGYFDVLMIRKYGQHDEVRLHATAVTGQAFTGVITGDSPDTLEILEFRDP